MADGAAEHGRAADGSFVAPLVLEYPYARTVGPTVGRFLTSLRAGRVEGVRAVDGRVLVPPPEYDPATGEPLTDWVEVSTEGIVTSWSWEPSPGEGAPLDRPFAWVLVRLDGADAAMLHALDCGSPAAVTAGQRVRIRWAAERTGTINDIECFEVVR